MKRIILCLSLFAFFGSQAQQINPVPDYVFSNRMSVGRNAVTDTAAYFSIGPRYGAIRGMMPPMVTDTASMSATKRNGLLIFSIQKNKYLYWDSVGSKWAEMAGTAGSAITGSGVAGYIPEFTTSTNLDTTRLYHSAGRFAIGSTTTTNGVFNVYAGQAYFDTSLKVGSQTLLADEGKNEVYVNTTGDSGAYALQVNGTVFTNSSLYLSGITKWELLANASTQLELINWNYSYRAAIFDTSRNIAFGNLTTAVGGDAALYINGKGKEVYVNSLIDAGAYALQVSGSIYNTNDALLSQISGSVLIGRASALIGEKFSTTGYAIIGTSSQGVFGDGGGGNVVVGSYTNSPIELRTNNIERMRIKTDGEVLIGTTTDAGAYALQVAGAIYNTTTITTGAPTGGSIKPWRLGEAATVSPTSPNRTIRVEIDGTVYYIHAKTTND